MRKVKGEFEMRCELCGHVASIITEESAEDLAFLMATYFAMAGHKGKVGHDDWRVMKKRNAREIM